MTLPPGANVAGELRSLPDDLGSDLVGEDLWRRASARRSGASTGPASHREWWYSDIFVLGKETKAFGRSCTRAEMMRPPRVRNFDQKLCFFTQDKDIPDQRSCCGERRRGGRNAGTPRSPTR